MEHVLMRNKQPAPGHRPRARQWAGQAALPSPAVGQSLCQGSGRSFVLQTLLLIGGGWRFPAVVSGRFRVLDVSQEGRVQLGVLARFRTAAPNYKAIVSLHPSSPAGALPAWSLPHISPDSEQGDWCLQEQQLFSCLNS